MQINLRGSELWTSGSRSCSPPPAAPHPGQRTSSLHRRKEACRTQQFCFLCHLISLHILPQANKRMCLPCSSSYNWKSPLPSLNFYTGPSCSRCRIPVAFTSCGWFLSFSLSLSLSLSFPFLLSPFVIYHVSIVVFLILFSFLKTFFSPLFMCFVFLFLYSVPQNAFQITTSNSLVISPFFLTCLHSFRKYLWRFNCVPDTGLNAGHITHGFHSQKAGGNQQTGSSSTVIALSQLHVLYFHSIFYIFTLSSATFFLEPETIG